MSEKNYETSELKELKDVLQTFTEFVWEMEEYLPEFYHFFDAMRQNIEICKINTSSCFCLRM